MPLFISKTIYENAKLGIWEVNEEEAYFNYPQELRKELMEFWLLF